MRSLPFVRLLLPVALVALPAGAQVSKVDFHELTTPNTTRYQAAIGAPLRSGGLDFYNATEFTNGGTNNDLTVWGTVSPPGTVSATNRPRNLNGANAVFSDVLGSEIDIVLAGTNFGFAPGGSFGIASIDFAHVYSDLYAGQAFTLAPFTVEIFGSNAQGGVFSQVFTFAVAPPDANGVRTPLLQTAFLNNRFSDVNNIWFNQSTGSGRAFQFTNVTPTPEPASLVLLGTGLLGVVGIARRNRKTAVTA